MNIQQQRGVASLPMYNFPAQREASSRFWQALGCALPSEAACSIDAPSELSQVTDLNTHWRDPLLVFSQTCGYPYVAGLRESVALIGTPDYAAIPEQPGWYNSQIVVRVNDKRSRLEDFHNARFAYNGKDSQSGCHAMMFMLQREFGSERFFQTCLETGGHEHSVAAVADGQADIAAIDAVTWRLLQRYSLKTESLRVLAQTPATPGLPFITSIRTHSSLGVGVLADAVETAIDAVGTADRSLLGLRGMWHSEPADYDLIEQRAMRSASVCQAHGLADNAVITPRNSAKPFNLPTAG